MPRATVRDSLTDRDLVALLQLHTNANAALMSGEARAFFEMLRPADDFTIMDPFGGRPGQGFDASPEGLGRLGRFFRAGTLEVELVAAYAGGDLAVLAVIERAEVEVGGLPRQAWALRVTVAYRREGPAWRLVHRHADPLRGGVSVAEAAAMARRPGPRSVAQ